MSNTEPDECSAEWYDNAQNTVPFVTEQICSNDSIGFPEIETASVTQSNTPINVLPTGIDRDDTTSSQENDVLTAEKEVNEIPFELETRDDYATDSQMIHMTETIQYVLQAYLSERYSSDLLPNILSKSKALQLRQANVETRQQLKTAIPSLQPRERIMYASASQASDRCNFLIQAFIVTRLQKLLDSPTIIWRNEEEREWRKKTENSRNNFTTMNNTPVESHVRDEAAALEILEKSFSKEVEKLWETYDIVEPKHFHECHTVHCQIPSNGSSVPLTALNLSEDSDKLSQVILALKGSLDFPSTQNSNRIESISQVSDDLQQSGSSLQHFTQTFSSGARTAERSGGRNFDKMSISPGSVITVDYETVKYLVDDGVVGLVG